MGPENLRSSQTAADARLTWPNVLAWRVRRQGLRPFVLDGVIAGTWSVNGKGRGTEVAIEPFEPMSAAVARQAQSEAERLTAILAARS
jgi:hypothetical protein